MSDDVVDPVGYGDAVQQGTLERLPHDAVDIPVAAIGGQQVEILAEHGLHVSRTFLCHRDDVLTTLHALDAFENIGILFKQLDRQPAFGIQPGVEI